MPNFYEINKINKSNKIEKTKPRWELLPLSTMESIVKVFTFGAQKYEDFGWIKGTESEHYSSLMRHISSWFQGDKLDAESGQSHLAHAACRLICLMYIEFSDDLRDDKNHPFVPKD